MELPARDIDHVLARTGSVWSALRGQRLFLTGGTGFFGKWLLETLVAADERQGLGLEAVVLTRDAKAFESGAPHLAASRALRFWEGDVRSFSFPEGEFPFVLHAAAPSSIGGRLAEDDPRQMVDVVVDGTRRVLELARARKTRTLLLVSSGAVYGRQNPEVSHVDESCSTAPDPLDPKAGYALAKRLAEHLGVLAARTTGLELKIARCFAFVGPHLPLDTHFAAGNFLRDALRGGPVRVAGDGTPWRSYLHAAELATWLWTILVRGVSCRPYNVGSEEAVTIEGLAREIAQLTGASVEIAQRPEPGRLPTRYVPSTQRARSELGLEQRIGVRAALERTLEWHRALRS